jgi:RNA polymerase sigma factor (sigma-70 family)
MSKTTGFDNRNAWKNFISTGCDKSFSKIYHNHFDLLYYIGMKYTSNTQLIEDSIQNVFVYLLKKRKSLTDVTNVKAYLVKSFRRQLLLDLRKQSRFSFSNQLFENQFDYFNGTEQTISEREELNELKRAMKKSLTNLSARQQEIIYLRYDCELSYEEISNIMEISVDSCYKSVYRSIRILKTSIEQTIAKGVNLFLYFLFSKKQNHKQHTDGALKFR